VKTAQYINQDTEEIKKRIRRSRPAMEMRVLATREIQSQHGLNILSQISMQDCSWILAISNKLVNRIIHIHSPDKVCTQNYFEPFLKLY